MADALSIGELVVRIGADGKPLDDALNKSSKSLKDFSKNADKAAADVEGAVRKIVHAFTAGAIAVAIKRTNDDILQLSKIADVSGIGVEALSKLKYAAGQTGVSFDELASAASQYSQTVMEMAREPNSKAAQSLRLLGIEAKDSNGQFKSLASILPELSDKWVQYADGANKSALFTGVLSENFRNLVPLLRQGSGGLSDLTGKAREAGAVLDASAVKKAKEFNASINNLITGIQGLTREFLLLAEGPLGAVVNGITTIVRAMNDWRNQSSATTEELNTQLSAHQERLAAVNTEIERMQNSGTGMSVVDKLQLGPAVTEAEMLKEKIKEIQALVDSRALTVDISNQNKPNAPDPNSLIKMREDLELFIDRLNGLPVLFGQSFAFDATPFEEAMARIDAAQQAGVLTAQQATRTKLMLQRQEQAAILDTASLASSTLTAVFSESKAAAIASGLINTAVGVTKALSASAPPLNFINAALVAASGLAQVAAIRSQSKSGGGGGVTPTSSAAASNAAAAADEPNTAAPSSVLEVRGLNPGQILTGDFVRGLMERIEEQRRDGMRVVFS